MTEQQGGPTSLVGNEQPTSAGPRDDVEPINKGAPPPPPNPLVAAGTGSGMPAASGLPPSVPPGTITADLASDTDDPVLLKQRLTRARERLGFYESFDRIIQENIRRSGELMLEAISFREQAQAQESEATESRAALDRRLAERDEQQARILNDLLTDIERSRATLATLSDRVQSALYELHGDPIAEPETVSAPEPTDAPPDQKVPHVPEARMELEPVAVPEVALEPDVPEVPSTPPDTSIDPPPAAEPRTVEVLVHGVPRAAVALSLQRHLGTVADVLTVEAREFAEGVLRLQVTSLRPLAEPDLAGWQDGNGPTILRADPTVLEVALPGAERDT